MIYLGPELEEAVDAYLEESGQSFSEAVRSTLAKLIGRPDLAETVKMGRPKKSPAKKAARPPVKKATRKRVK